MSAWAVSPILAPLIKEIRLEHPGVIIGTIGDAAHRDEESDHNPDEWGWVCAADAMLGPHFTAPDAEHLFDRLRSLRDPRGAYTIYNRRIWSRTVQPYVVRLYRGKDPHTGHVHISVPHAQHPRPSTAWNIYPTEADVTLQETLNAVNGDIVDPDSGIHHNLVALVTESAPAAVYGDISRGPDSPGGQSGLNLLLANVIDDATAPLIARLAAAEAALAALQPPA